MSRQKRKWCVVVTKLLGFLLLFFLLSGCVLARGERYAQVNFADCDVTRGVEPRVMFVEMLPEEALKEVDAWECSRVFSSVSETRLLAPPDLYVGYIFFTVPVHVTSYDGLELRTLENEVVNIGFENSVSERLLGEYLVFLSRESESVISKDPATFPDMHVVVAEGEGVDIAWSMVAPSTVVEEVGRE